MCSFSISAVQTLLATHMTPRNNRPRSCERRGVIIIFIIFTTRLAASSSTTNIIFSMDFFLLSSSLVSALCSV